MNTADAGSAPLTGADVLAAALLRVRIYPQCDVTSLHDPDATAPADAASTK